MTEAPEPIKLTDKAAEKINELLADTPDGAEPPSPMVRRLRPPAQEAKSSTAT